MRRLKFLLGVIPIPNISRNSGNENTNPSLRINPQAFGMALLRHWIFKRILCKILPTQILRIKKFISVFKTFTTFVFCRFCTKNPWAEKKWFLKGRFGNFPRNPIQAVVKIKNDCDILWKLFVMLKGPVRIYNAIKIFSLRFSQKYTIRLGTFARLRNKPTPSGKPQGNS